MSKFLLLLLLSLLLNYISLLADGNTDDTPDQKVKEISDEQLDTLKHYRLNEIISLSNKIKSLPKLSTTVLPYHIIQKQDASSVSELFSTVASAKLTTNSRGESLIYMRGSGERQTGIFFDGAYYNIAWDNRLDLSLIPAGIIGQLKIENASSSVLYGANILGGVVNISTLSRDVDGFNGLITLQGSDGNSKDISLTHDGRIGKFAYILNYSYLNSDGQLLPNLDSLLHYQNNNSSLRTNTDINRNSFFSRLTYDFDDDTKLGFSFSKIKSEKGIASEHHKTKKVRFWRYNDWDRAFLNFNLNHHFSENINLQSSFWYDDFMQQIDSYENQTYSNIDESQLDKDKSFGSRIILNIVPADDNNINIALNYLTSEHEQIKTSSDTNTLATNYFSQNIISISANHQFLLYDFTIESGLGYDIIKKPLTGIYTEFENTTDSDYSAQFNITYNYSDNINFSSAIARKTRFPTLREQFDGALGKFIVNENLRPETGILSELGVNYSIKNLQLSLTFFNSNYNDLIEQIKHSDGQKERVNFDAIINGLELKFRNTSISWLKSSGYLTYMISQRKDANIYVDLEQRPQLLANLDLTAKLPYDFKSSLEFEYTGEQLDSEETLPATLLLNFRTSYTFTDHELLEAILSTLYFRVNNILDTVKYSQLGLPEPGRTLVLGIKSNLHF